jgi:hypothetical protein
LSAIAKALAAPGRLALVGVLATCFPLPVEVSDLQAQFKRLGTTFDRELGQLAEAGLIEIVEWQPAAPGTTPEPALVAFSSAYLRRIPQLITTLHQIERQVHPAAPRPVLSERERILNRFMPGSQVLAWPEPFMQQRYLSEEIVKRFAPDTRYTEREVNAILKEVYAYDYCVVRRSLIDLGLMQRDHGVYWRVG